MKNNNKKDLNSVCQSCLQQVSMVAVNRNYHRLPSRKKNGFVTATK